MGVTYLPGPPQFGQGGGGGDPQSLVQLALAVKSYKLNESNQKKQEAMQRLELLMSNPELMMSFDPKGMEKDFKTLGFKINDKPPVEPKVIGETPQGGGRGGGGTPTAAATGAAQLGSVMQANKSGAQAASPASPNAAGKSPGGGVATVGNPQLAEHLAGEASKAYTEKFGQLAPLYLGAQSKLEQQQMQAKTIQEIEGLKQTAADPNNPNAAMAMGRLMIMSGKEITDATLRGILASSGSKQAMDVALGNMTPAAKMENQVSIIKSLTSSPAVMDKLANPLDVSTIARSIVDSAAMPQVQMKPHTLDELKRESEDIKTLGETFGMPIEWATLVARGRLLGLSPTDVLPKAAWGFLTKKTLSEREVGAKEVTASAAMIGALAEKEKADTEHSKIKLTLDTKEYDQLNDRVKLMIEADKAKKPWPDDIRQGYLNQLARATGLTPEQVDHWYKWTAGWEYKPDPASELAKMAAGGAQKGKPAKREPTFAERGGVKGAAERAATNLPKDKEGNPILNPFALEHELLTKGREKALQYMRDIAVGTEKPKEGPGL